VQISRPGHPVHPPSSDGRKGAHSGVQLDTVSAGLLQCCVAWSSSQQYSEAAAHAEHSGAARVILQSARRMRLSPSQPLIQQLHWFDNGLTIQAGRPDVQYPPHFHTSLPQPSHPASHNHSWLRSSAMPRVCQPTTRTNFADRAFRCSAPAVWNSLTADIVDSSSLPIFRRKLKTFFFRHTFSSS